MVKVLLSWAASGGETAWLLAARTDKMELDGLHGTPLHWAAHLDRVQIAQQLLAAGAEVQARSRGEAGVTPIYEARSEEMAALLLGAGAEVQGMLTRAAQYGRAGVVKQLLSVGADPNSWSSRSMSPLSRAVSWHREATVALLLAAGADPEHALLFLWRSSSSNRATAQLPIAEALLVAGADPNVDNAGLPANLRKSEFASSPLHQAALRGEAVMVDLLLGAGANPNAATASGLTPLHLLGSSRGNITGTGVGSQAVAALARLLAAGANPNAVTSSGRTPLHDAVQQSLNAMHPRGWAAGVAHLLAAGADPRLPDTTGVTPLLLAAQEEQWALVEMMQAPASIRELKMDYGVTPLHRAAQQGDREQVLQLLAAGADSNRQSYYGETPLHLAAQRQEVAIVELLLQAGADLQAKTLDGYTPLHAAAQTGSRTVVETLLAAGADGQCSTAQGETPYQIAVRRDRPEVAALLDAVKEESAASRE